MIKQYEEAIKDDKNELESLERFLYELKAPANVESMPEWIKNNRSVKKLEFFVAEKVQNIFEKTISNSIAWPTVTFICIFSFLFLSICSMFIRPDFFNVSQI